MTTSPSRRDRITHRNVGVYHDKELQTVTVELCRVTRLANWKWRYTLRPGTPSLVRLATVLHPYDYAQRHGWRLYSLEAHYA